MVMPLLPGTDALIHCPPGSFFSFYGAAMKRHRQAERQTVHDLQWPWDLRDRLSPALIL
jgi:hypothetical protein